MNVHEIIKSLKEIRLAQGIDQVKFAALTGTYQPLISRVERGDCENVRLQTLNRFAKALGYTIELSLRKI